MQIKTDILDSFTPVQRELREGVAGPGMITASARAVANGLREHFRDFEQTRPNRMGFPRTHFWSDVRGSVQNPIVANPKFATVEITHRAIRQRVEGGKILPEHAQYLTIPANAQAYGHVAREFQNLHFGFAENRYGNLAPALIENLTQSVTFGRKKKDGSRKVTPGEERGGDVFFWLVKQVYQQPDATVLPTPSQVETWAVTGASEYAQALADRAQAKGETSR